MWRWTLIALAVLVGLAILIYLVGLFVSKTHSATTKAAYDCKPKVVWKIITDHVAAPTWRPEVSSVKPGEDRDGHPVWIEITKFGPMALEVVEVDEPRRYVTRIADERLPFGGTWTFLLTEGGENRTTLQITEDGVIKSPLFRFMSRFIFGYHSNMDSYLRSLGEKLGEEVEPVHVGA